MTNRVLSIDIETFSSIDLRISGAHAYAAAHDFQILLFGFAFDDEPVRVVEIAKGEELPRDVLEALTDPAVTKAAWNAAFERVCIGRMIGEYLDPDQWSCSMALSAYSGHPSSLALAAISLQMPLKKDSIGKQLIELFCKPKAPDMFNPDGRILPDSAPEQWAKFIEYCRHDVEVERSIRKKLEAHPLPEIERRVWSADQRINDRGVRVDLDLSRHAIAADEISRGELLEEARAITGLNNPASVEQLKRWVHGRTGRELTTLNKAAALDLIDTTDDDAIRRALELRLKLGRSSVAKYEAVLVSACPDGRARGLLQYYGASRTGRWGGRRIQPQNLPKTRLSDLDVARDLLRSGDYGMLDMLYDDVPDVLSQLIRTALIASEDHQLISADYSAIEARVLAWLAGEEWVLDVFRSGGGIYESTASQMFKIPVEEIDRSHPARERGKVATLACGYGGGVGALEKMGALRAGLEESELQGIVGAWREANPRIVRFWYDVERAALAAVRGRETRLARGLVFRAVDGALRVRLPAGRELVYMHPRIETDPRFGRDQLTYSGLDSNGQWGRAETYGGKLAENITQAVARDCLAESIIRLEAEFPEAPIVLHVHDEIVIDSPLAIPTDDAIRRITSIMSRPMSWAPDLPLEADAFCSPYFRAD